jgi:hypothetical protein
MSLFEGTFTSVVKDKKLQGIHKTVETQVFLTVFCLEGSGS